LKKPEEKIIIITKGVGQSTSSIGHPQKIEKEKM
jgi:hypothetical protein